MKKIFVLNLRGNIIGDSIREAALFEFLKEKYPKSHIVTTGGSLIGEIHKNNPNIDEFIVIKELDYLTKRISKIKKLSYMTAAMIKARKLMHGYDAVIITQNIKFPYILLSLSAGISDIMMKEQLHYRKYFSRMYFKKEEENKIRRYIGKGKGVALNIESIDINRCWSRENYSELINGLLKQNYKVYILGTDLEYNKPLIERFGNKVVNLIGKTSIRETALIIKNMDLYIGNDSGLTHVASAVDTDSITILIDSNVDIFNDPRRSTSIKLRKPSIQEVIKTAKRLIK